MSEGDQRASVVAEVKTWIGTPYHSHGRSKGAGVDCAMLLAEVYHAVGLIDRVEPGFYPPDWHLHRGTERYIEQVIRIARELHGEEEKRPGDILLVKFGRTFSHGAVIVDWPMCIHAMMESKTGYVDALRDGVFRAPGGSFRPFRFFSLWHRGAV